MPSSAAAAPYTWDDFVALEEDDLRELIDGELVEVVAEDEVFRPSSFDGLEIPLAKLWPPPPSTPAAT